jgi:hypothetical protein
VDLTLELGPLEPFKVLAVDVFGKLKDFDFKRGKFSVEDSDGNFCYVVFSQDCISSTTSYETIRLRLARLVVDSKRLS